MTPITGLVWPLMEAVDRGREQVAALPAGLVAAWANLPSEKLAAALLPASGPPGINKGSVAGVYDVGLSFAKERGAGAVEALCEDAQGKVEAFLKTSFGEGPVDPAACLARVGKALAFHSAMGLAAHGVATAASVDILGSIDINATGLAAAIGDLAGFHPCLNAIQGPFYEGYLRQPWTYQMQDVFRPNIPGVRDLLRLHLKRRADPRIGPEVAEPNIRDYLAKHGYADQWIADLLADAPEEPNMRALQVMMEAPGTTARPEWLRSKMLLLGYEEADADLLAEGLLVRLKSTYVRQRITNALDRAALGLSTPAEFAAEIAPLNLPPAVRAVLYELADDEADLTLKRQELAALKLSYSRDEIDDATFDYELETLGFERDFRGLILEIERLKRMRKVWIRTPTDQARDALAIYRQSFRAGLLTEAEYRAALDLAGIDPERIALYVALDSRARDREVAADLRQWQLPVWREQAVTGAVSLEAYAARLDAVGFPDRLEAQELALVAYLRQRHQEQRVQSRQVPTVERAYVLGLVAAWTLERTYQEAGWREEEIAARRPVLDELRNREKALRDKYGPTLPGEGLTKAEQQAIAEWQYVNGEITAAELMAIYVALKVPPDTAEARLRKLTALRAAP
jgi:hypothetical protein